MSWTLVTGAAKHLGADLCLALAQQGYNIVIHYYRSQEHALRLKQKCQACGVQAEIIQGDFSSSASTVDFIKRYLKQFQETVNLINNVGNYLVKSALNTEVEEWEELFQINLHAPFILIKHLVCSITLHKGSIINIGLSGIEKVQADTYFTAYGITKLGLWKLTRSLARELAPAGVRVNMVSPGYLETAVDLPSDLARLPMGRPARSEEVSRVVLFLLDSANAYITGQNIEVAGGVGL